MFKGTVQEFADLLGCDRLTANGALQYLLHLKIAKQVDKRKSSAGRGKPSIVWEVPESFTVKLPSLVKVAV